MQPGLGEEVGEEEDAATIPTTTIRMEGKKKLLAKVA